MTSPAAADVTSWEISSSDGGDTPLPVTEYGRPPQGFTEAAPASPLHSGDEVTIHFERKANKDALWVNFTLNGLPSELFRNQDGGTLPDTSPEVCTR